MADIRAGYVDSWTDYEPILGRIVSSQSQSFLWAGAGARTTIVGHSTSTAALAAAVACTRDAEVFERVHKTLDPHEFVFVRLMALDALGCTWNFSSLFRYLSRFLIRS